MIRKYFTKNRVGTKNGVRVGIKYGVSVVYQPPKWPH
jgi:hypothetical protein